jgi:ComF family protein
LENKDVTEKFYGRLDVQFVGALFYFHKKSIVQEMIHNLKYRGHQEIGTALGLWYGNELKKAQILETIDVIIPVPLHKKREKQRGYNQVVTFGNALSECLEIPLNNQLLFRMVHTETQVRKNLVDRSDLAEKGFTVTVNEDMHNKHFLLIDDVITTGATLEACGKALLSIPGAKLSIVCIAAAHL